METLTVVSSGREAAQGVSTSPHRHGLSIPNRQHLTPPTQEPKRSKVKPAPKSAKKKARISGFQKPKIPVGVE